MALLAWFLIALGLCAPLLTTYLTGAHSGAAGYASGTGYGFSIIAIVLVIVQARSMAPERRVRLYFLAAAVVVGLNGWSSFKIMQGARIDREIASARPAIKSITEAATTEAGLINIGQIAQGDVSPAWKPYATATPGIELGNSTVALQLRFIELARRARSRELDLARALRGEVEASAIGTALSPDRLIRAGDRADALARVGRYRGFIQSYVSSHAKLNEQAEADVRTLGLPRASEDQMIGGQLRRARENAANIDQFVDQELQAIDSVQAVIRFVDAHAEAARVKDGLLWFSDPSVQAEYESVLARLPIDPSLQ